MARKLNVYQKKRMLKQMARMGRGGDDQIVHTNPAERAMLKEMGGAGTINPKTGLKEYKYGGNVSEGGKKQGASERGGQGPNAGGREFGSQSSTGRGGQNVGPGAGTAPFSRSTTRKIAKFDDLSAENALRLGGAALATLGGPVGAAINAIGSAVTTDDPMNPYGKPDGTTDYTSADSPNRMGEGEEEARRRRAAAARRPATVLTPKPGATWLGGGLKLVSGT